MEGKELIRRILRHDAPERIGFSFLDGNPSDTVSMPGIGLRSPADERLSRWGRHEALLARVPEFSGEVRLSPEGNIFGRFDGKTKGECIRGALQGGWEALDSYSLPTLDPDYEQTLAGRDFSASDRYVLSYLPLAVFAPLRDARHIDNALMDLLLEPDNVRVFLDRITDLSVSAVPRLAAMGADGAIIYDDLGMQHAPFFSPAVFRELLKPYYKKLADALHESGMDFFVHSCGNVTAFLPDFIDAGVDAFQFDQPELHGVELLASEFGDKAAFFCPVDIQRIMPSGDRKTIEAGALRMVQAFASRGGGLIVKDYDNWQDINVLPEWQQWARDCVLRNAKILPRKGE